MLNLKIEINGIDTDELDLALSQILEKVCLGFTSGFDQRENNFGDYTFTITDEDEHSP